ncbi:MULTISPECIES: ParA family protein [Sphingobacterium]|uniref:ParA family protein n=1 Tax=Sphingobacterium TaxID=28453 RepID=UPI00257B3E98|nr:MULTISPECIES: ParA family protein [Sphingobacterium]
MVLVFANQKGGAGKSTLAMLYANYLSLVKQEMVTVLDMDYQKSLLSHFEDSKSLDNPEPYQVIDVELEKFPVVYEVLFSEPAHHIIIDLPGKIDDDNLIPVIEAADIIVIPFHYDRLTFQSTNLFAMIVNDLNPVAKKVFVPNLIKTTVKYDLKSKVDEHFSQFGTISPLIPHKVALQRLTTRELSSELLPIAESLFIAITS